MTIKIGNKSVDVPSGYVAMEWLYCLEQYAEFANMHYKHPDKSRAQQAILDKRVEYYNQYKASLNETT